MPPTRTKRTRAEIAEANQALIARRRQRLYNLQNNQPPQENPISPQPPLSKHFYYKLWNTFNNSIYIFLTYSSVIKAKNKRFMRIGMVGSITNHYDSAINERLEPYLLLVWSWSPSNRGQWLVLHERKIYRPSFTTLFTRTCRNHWGDSALTRIPITSFEQPLCIYINQSNWRISTTTNSF